MRLIDQLSKTEFEKRERRLLPSSRPIERIRRITVGEALSESSSDRRVNESKSGIKLTLVHPIQRISVLSLPSLTGSLLLNLPRYTRVATVPFSTDPSSFSVPAMKSRESRQLRIVTGLLSFLLLSLFVLVAQSSSRRGEVEREGKKKMEKRCRKIGKEPGP